MTPIQKELLRDEIINLLDDYRHAVDRRVCAEIDASCCRTDRDWAHMHKMEEAEEEVRTRVEDTLFSLTGCRKEQKGKTLMEVFTKEAACMQPSTDASPATTGT